MSVDLGQRQKHTRRAWARWVAAIGASSSLDLASAWDREELAQEVALALGDRGRGWLRVVEWLDRVPRVRRWRLVRPGDRDALAALLATRFGELPLGALPGERLGPDSAAGEAHGAAPAARSN